MLGLYSVAQMFHCVEWIFQKVLRRGALMLMLQQSAVTLPLWIGNPGESPPSLCGAVPAGADYIAKPTDKVTGWSRRVPVRACLLADVISS